MLKFETYFSMTLTWVSYQREVLRGGEALSKLVYRKIYLAG